MEGVELKLLAPELHFEVKVSAVFCVTLPDNPCNDSESRCRPQESEIQAEESDFLKNCPCKSTASKN